MESVISPATKKNAATSTNATCTVSRSMTAPNCVGPTSDPIEAPVKTNPKLRPVERVGEREKGLGMLVLVELVDGLAAHPLRGRVGRLQFGKGSLQLLQAPVQAVVLGVGDERIVLDVIAMIVPSDHRSQVIDERTGLLNRERIDVVEGLLQLARLLNQTHERIRRG